MNDKLISIIVPVYKVEKYIERCLMSVMGQTYNHSAIECILVDDCTPDHSMEMAKEIVRRENTDIAFVFLRNQINMGLSISRNTGMSEARGEYILFLDSDDYIMPNCVQLLMEQTVLHPGVEVVVGNFFHDKAGGGLKVRSDMIPRFLQDHHQIFSLYLCEVLPVMAWNVLIRRTIAKDHHLHFAERLLQEDVLWSFHLYRSISKMAFVPEVTYQYCDNEGSIMNKTKNAAAFANSYCYILLDISRFLERVNYVDLMTFSIRLLFRGLDCASQPEVDTKYLRRLNLVKNRLFLRTLRDGRIVLSFAFLLLYRPFYYIKYWRVFRRHYDHWIYFVRIVSTSLNVFH